MEDRARRQGTRPDRTSSRRRQAASAQPPLAGHLVLATLLALAAACGGAEMAPSPQGAGPSLPPGAAGIPAANPPASNAGSTAAPPLTPAGMTPNATAGSSAAPAAGSAAIGGGRAVPRDVCGVLQQNGCISCHQSQLQGGAPMPLQWRADFMRKPSGGTSMGAVTIARITDAARPMPPVTTMRPLPPADHVAVIEKWVSAGMPGAEGGACEDVPTDPNGTQASWSKQPWPEEECEYVMTIGAHGTAGTPLAQDPSPYEPPEIETSYHCFYEQVPWGDKKVHALATRIRLEGDDTAIVHHTVLSALSPGDGMSILGGTPPSGGGDHLDCPNPSGSTVAVWAPGPHTSVTFPKDTGVLMPSGTSGAYLELQIHYNNAKAGMKSRVSFEVCATSKLRPNTAGVHWLGYENATAAVPLAALGPELQPKLDNQGGGVAVGTCVAKQRAQVLWLAPHMHELGKHTKVEILRKNGAIEPLHDAPFDFSEQTAYFFDDLWIEQGESIRTTCTWDTSRPIVFGFASNEEMCFVYTLAHPIGALTGTGAEKGVVGGELNCAGSM